MLHYAWGPAQHSRVAPIAARIPSSNAGERGPRANVECGNNQASISCYIRQSVPIRTIGNVYNDDL